MMKQALSSIAVASLALFAGQAALAQAQTRAEVMKEAAEANMAGEIAGTPQGQPEWLYGETSPREKAENSVRSTDMRRRSAAEANKAGDIAGTPQGQPQYEMGQTSPRDRAATSTVSPSERRREAAEANRAGEIPSNEIQRQNPPRP